MNKSDLIDAVAQAAGTNKKTAVLLIESFSDAIRQRLASGESVVLAGFGSFSVAQRAARNGRNPRTGETVSIAARRTPKFKAGARLVESVK